MPAAPQFQFAGTTRNLPSRHRRHRNESGDLPLAPGPSFKVDPKQVKALQNTRSGVIVGEETAQRYGIGDRPENHAAIARAQEGRFRQLDLRRGGHIQEQRHARFRDCVIVNYPYVNESLPEGQGKTRSASQSCSSTTPPGQRL